MFQSLKCLLKGHMYVDSRSQPGTEVCVRCRHRRPFEGLEPMQAAEDAVPEDGDEPPAAHSFNPDRSLKRPGTLSPMDS